MSSHRALFRLVELTGLVDGMDFSPGWARENFKLDGTNEEVWTEHKVDAIRASVPLIEISCLLEVSMGPGGVSRRETWEYIVWRKADRVGCEISKEFYAMNFRHKESEDQKTALLKEMVIDFSSTSIVDE